MSTGTVYITEKKRLSIFPSPAGMSLTKLFLAGVIKLFPARESLISDIPAGDGKMDILFYSVAIPRFIPLQYIPQEQSIMHKREVRVHN